MEAYRCGPPDASTMSESGIGTSGLLQLLTAGIGESRGGISPPRAPKTVREPLDSHGFRCSASDIHETPMRKEGWLSTANPSQPISRAVGSFAQALVLPARPAD